MPKSDRGTGFKALTAFTCLLIAGLSVALVFHLGWKNGNAEGEYEANTDTYAKHAQDEIEDCFALTDRSSVPECVRNVVKAQNEHERAEADLVAQTEMGLWALGMLVVTSAMAVVTGFGVYYVWKTLLATQRMALDAREIGEAQARAYIHFEIKTVEIGIPDGPYDSAKWASQNITVTVHGTLNNTGQSPARRIALSYDIHCVERGEIVKSDARFLGANTAPSASIISAQGHTQQQLKRNFPVDWEALVNRKSLIFIVFGITFEDVFKRTIETPLTAGHLDGISGLIKSRVPGEEGQQVGIRFIYDEIHGEEEYEY